MAIITTKITNTVGASFVVAFITNQPVDDIHCTVNNFAEENFGQWSSVEYIEVVQVPAFKIDQHVDYIVALDELN